MQDTAYIRCASKITRTRSNAITEAARLGFPVAPYKCPNGGDHWHVGRSIKNSKMFSNDRTRWESLARNQDTEVVHE